MGTIHLSPGSIGFTKGSDRSGHFTSTTLNAGNGNTVRRSFVAVWKILIRWQARYEMRRHLLQIEDRLLCDIGLTRRQADIEAKGMFRFL